MPDNPGPDKPQAVFTYLRLWNDLLERLVYRFRREGYVKTALDDLAELLKADSESLDLAREARIRWAAFRVIWDYAERRPGRSGAGAPGLLQLNAHLCILRDLLLDDLELAQHLHANLDLGEFELDPEAAGGAKRIRPHSRGPRPDVLHHIVKVLLRKRHREWDGDGPFPGGNDQGLRDSIYQELATGARRASWSEGFRSARSWGAAVGGSFFDLEKIDPRPGGPLSEIIRKLKYPGGRKKRRQRRD